MLASRPSVDQGKTHVAIGVGAVRNDQSRGKIIHAARVDDQLAVGAVISRVWRGSANAKTVVGVVPEEACVVLRKFGAVRKDHGTGGIGGIVVGAAVGDGHNAGHIAGSQIDGGEGPRAAGNMGNARGAGGIHIGTAVVCVDHIVAVTVIRKCFQECIGVASHVSASVRSKCGTAVVTAVIERDRAIDAKRAFHIQLVIGSRIVNTHIASIEEYVVISAIKLLQSRTRVRIDRIERNHAVYVVIHTDIKTVPRSVVLADGQCGEGLCVRCGDFQTAATWAGNANAQALVAVVPVECAVIFRQGRAVRENDGTSTVGAVARTTLGRFQLRTNRPGAAIHHSNPRGARSIDIGTAVIGIDQIVTVGIIRGSGQEPGTAAAEVAGAVRVNIGTAIVRAAAELEGAGADDKRARHGVAADIDVSSVTFRGAEVGVAEIGELTDVPAAVGHDFRAAGEIAVSVRADDGAACSGTALEVGSAVIERGKTNARPEPAREGARAIGVDEVGTGDSGIRDVCGCAYRAADVERGAGSICANAHIA